LTNIPRQQGLYLDGGSVLEQIGIQLSDAVGEGGDFGLAHHQAVIARHLGFELRRFGLGRRGRHQETGRKAGGQEAGKGGALHGLLHVAEGGGGLVREMHRFDGFYLCCWRRLGKVCVSVGY
jgi:hypothetical protein